MKKEYSKPSVSVVNVRLFNSVLEGPDVGVGNNSVETGEGFAKENAGEFEDESLINPTQPNLWDDNEEE